MSESVTVPLAPRLSASHTQKKSEGRDLEYRLRFGAEEYEVTLQLLSLSGVASCHGLKSRLRSCDHGLGELQLNRGN